MSDEQSERSTLIYIKEQGEKHYWKHTKLNPGADVECPYTHPDANQAWWEGWEKAEKQDRLAKKRSPQ